MDITSLLGNKIFSSLYDPKADTLFADFRKKAEDSMNSLRDVVSKADSTKAIINKIPGVSDSTKAELDKLLAESKSFTSSSSGLSPSAILGKKAEISAKINNLVQTAQEEGVAKKAKTEQKKKAELAAQAKGEVSMTKLASKLYKRVKTIAFWLIILILGLVGGSLASNGAIALPPYMRFYYFIYGSILFPISYIFAIKNYIENKPLKFHSVLAPLVEGTSVGLFSYKSLFVEPLPVQFVAEATALPEAAVQAVIANNVAQVAPAPVVTSLMETISKNAAA